MTCKTNYIQLIGWKIAALFPCFYIIFRPLFSTVPESPLSIFFFWRGREGHCNLLYSLFCLLAFCPSSRVPFLPSPLPISLILSGSIFFSYLSSLLSFLFPFFIGSRCLSLSPLFSLSRLYYVLPVCPLLASSLPSWWYLHGWSETTVKPLSQPRDEASERSGTTWWLLWNTSTRMSGDIEENIPDEGWTFVTME